jgi:uracil phosphoribosyltransferase
VSTTLSASMREQPGDCRFALSIIWFVSSWQCFTCVGSKAITFHLFFLLRLSQDKDTPSAEFIAYSKRLMRLLAEETLAKLPSTPHTVTTPTNATFAGELSIADTHPDQVCVISIVRAGDSLLESFRDLVPGLRVGKVWIQRNEKSPDKEAIHSCTKLPTNIQDMTSVILCDPMLATGGSSTTALRILVDEYGVDPQRIVFANVVCCPEGLRLLEKEFPSVDIVTCSVDKELNENKYIVPGLGDYGDRFFNTI